MIESVKLTTSELQLYSRQLIISGWGMGGQKELKRAKVVVAGVGGLGCLASIYLAAAGVGRLVLIDKGTIKLSNLNRQILYWSNDIGKYKVESAVEKLRSLNPEIKIDGFIAEINEETVCDLLKGATVVIDGQDNFKTRSVINKACVELKTPFIHGAVYGLEGILMTIIPHEGPCLRCLYPVVPPEKELFPVLGVTPATIACLQTIETLKIITGIGELCVGRLLTFDGERMKFTEIPISRNPNCQICGKARTHDSTGNLNHFSTSGTSGTS